MDFGSRGPVALHFCTFIRRLDTAFAALIQPLRPQYQSSSLYHAIAASLTSSVLALLFLFFLLRLLQEISVHQMSAFIRSPAAQSLSK